MNSTIINKTKEIYDGLYANDVNSFRKVPDYLNELETTSSVFLKETVVDIELLITEIKKVIQAYKTQSVIAIADILKYEIEPFLFKIYNIRERDYFYNKEHISRDNFKKNISVLDGERKEIYREFRNIDTSVLDNDKDIIIDKEGNIAVNTISGLVLLNSIYDDEYASLQWVNSLGKINYNDIVLICGIGNFSYIRKLLKSVDKDICIIIYEPDKRIFEANIIYTDIRDILLRKNTLLLIEGINEELLENYLGAAFNFINIFSSKIFSLPGYDVLYYDLIKKYVKKCTRYLEYLKVNNNSVISLNEKVNYNAIMNLQFIKKSTDILRIKELLEEDKIGDRIPAIVVAAGPSLDKNIKYLSEAKGKACIICVDSAVRMMLKNNIIPDMLVTLDPDKERILFEDDRVNDMYLCYSVHGTHDVIKKNKKKKILYNNMAFWYNSLKELNVETAMIDVGGSVANAAFSIARYLGFKNIIVIGQDLAFTNEKKHASVVYDDGGINEKEKGLYTTIDGIDGTQMLTYANFKVYRDWYERLLESDKALNMINATEGGALIHGAINMRLEDAIKKYCNEGISVAQYIEKSKLLINGDLVEKFNHSIKECIQEIKKIRETYMHCLQLYDEILLTDDVKQRMELSKKITNLNDEMEKKKELEFIGYYARKTEEIESCGIYDEENKNDIWEDTVKRGKKVVQAYIEGADIVKNLFKKVCMEL